MASALKYLKGVHTGYGNDLKKQITEASVIADEDLHSGMHAEMLKSIDYSCDMLNERSKIMERQSEKLISEIQNGEDPLIDLILNSDAEV